MIKYPILLLVSAGISLAITPLVRFLALKKKILDFPSSRKVHSKPIPLLGGVPIFLAFNLTLMMGVLLGNEHLAGYLKDRWVEIFVSQILILALGIYDDIKQLEPKVKFLGQVLIGLLMVAFGFDIHSIASPFSGKVIQLGLFSIPITIIWLVGITNALNLVDGLDGLAAGTSVIVCATIFAVSFFQQNIGVALVTLILAGSILGFLRYNFYPAKIFLGDSGSLYLGFMLASLSVQGSSKEATLVAVLAPILALGLPIMDTLLSMIRRFLKSINMVDFPSRNGKLKVLFFKGFSMFEADKDHVHHRILKLGFSHRNTVIILYGLCGFLCAMALLSTAVINLSAVAFLVAILLVFLIGVRSLKYQEFKILENGLLLPLFDIPVFNKRVFHGFFDFCAICLSFYLSFLLVFHAFGGEQKGLFIKTLPFVLLFKIMLFQISGIYKSSWAYASLEDVMKILKAVLLSCFGTVLWLEFLFGAKAFGGIVFYLTDFYLLLTLIMSSRFSYRVISSFYNKNASYRNQKILIYGAGYRGSTLLKEIRHNGTYAFKPVGFIDDDAKKKGTSLQGCPILGSYEDLEKIVGKSEVSEIIVSTPKIKNDRIKVLTEFCKQKGIILRQFEFRFYEFPGEALGSN